MSHPRLLRRRGRVLLDLGSSDRHRPGQPPAATRSRRLEIVRGWHDLDLHLPSPRRGRALLLRHQPPHPRAWPATLVTSTVNRSWPGDEVYRSTDGGSTWTASLTNRKPLHREIHRGPPPLSPHWITDIDIDPFDSQPRHLQHLGGGLFQNHQSLHRRHRPHLDFLQRLLEELVPLGLLSPTAGPPLVTVTGDYTGWRHDDLNRSPLRGRHSPGNGSNGRIAGADLAPEKLIRQNSTATYFSQDAATTWSAFPTEPPTVANGHGSAILSADGQRILWCPTNSEA